MILKSPDGGIYFGHGWLSLLKCYYQVADLFSLFSHLGDGLYPLIDSVPAEKLDLNSRGFVPYSMQKPLSYPNIVMFGEWPLW